MKILDEQELEKFISDNKEKFNIYKPDRNHSKLFLKKLAKTFREVISIVPYLVKVTVATLFVFILSFLVWRNYICPPLTHVSLKYWKVERDYKHHIKRALRLNYEKYNNDLKGKADFESRLQKYDETYAILKGELKENPSAENTANLLKFYKDKLLMLEENSQNLR